MKNQVAIDGAGRLVLPKAVRDELHLVAGDLLDISVDQGDVRLRPASSGGRMVKEGDFWVFDAGRPIDSAEIDDFIRAQRHARDAKFIKGVD